MNDVSKLRIHVEFKELREDFEGTPDDVVRAFLISLSKIYPNLELIEKLMFQPDLNQLANTLVGLIELAPEGALVLDQKIPSEEAIIIYLVGCYVGYRFGKIDDNINSAGDIAKNTGKAIKTISNQLAWMVDDGLVERVERGKYRISSLGIKRFEQIVEG